MKDRQMQIYEFIDDLFEPPNNGSPLNFEQIIEKNKKLNEEAEQKWQKDHYRGAPKEILRDY